MSKRPRSHTLEDLSRGRLREAFEREGWTVEDLAKDYGEDLFVRIFENGQSTPYSFLVQAKATDDLSRFRRKRSVDMKFRVECGHIAHWIRFAEPVFLTVWDAAADITFWVCVQDALANPALEANKKSRNATMQISIPLENRLDTLGLKRMRGIAKLRFQRANRQADASEVLKEALEKVGVFIRTYEPDEGLVEVEYSNGDRSLCFFGDLKKQIEKLSTTLKLPFTETFSQSLKIAWAELEARPIDPEAIRRELRQDIQRRELEAAEE